MPGFPVLTTIQPIVGADFHKAIPPPPPAGPLMTPHVVVWGSGLSQKSSFMWAVATSKASSPESGCPKPVVVGFGHACGRTHDAGPHPGHIWPNVLLPLVLLGSASKAEFGSGTVKVRVAGADSADMAVNVAFVLNANLDCQDFPIPPLPTGMCFTIHYSVKAGFSFADFCRGLVQMVVDMALTWAVGAVCAVVTGAISGLIASGGRSGVMAAMRSAIGSNFGLSSSAGLRSAAGLMNDGAGYFASNGRLFVNGWRAMPPALANAWRNAPVDQVMGIAGSMLSTFGLGTPVGYAPEYAPVGGSKPTSASSRANRWIDGLWR
jgi:hypothetical protein